MMPLVEKCIKRKYYDAFGREVHKGDLIIAASALSFYTSTNYSTYSEDIGVFIGKDEYGGSLMFKEFRVLNLGVRSFVKVIYQDKSIAEVHKKLLDMLSYADPLGTAVRQMKEGDIYRLHGGLPCVYIGEFYKEAARCCGSGFVSIFYHSKNEEGTTDEIISELSTATCGKIANDYGYYREYYTAIMHRLDCLKVGKSKFKKGSVPYFKTVWYTSTGTAFLDTYKLV